MWFPTLSALWRSRSGQRADRTRASRAQRPRSAAPRRSFVPRLTVLEDRTVPSTFTVNNLNDSGPESLRAAITAANADPDTDVIRFASGLQGTLTLASQLSITQDLTINGPGAGKITVSGGDANRVFGISGSTTEVTLTGLTIADGRAAQAAGIDNAGGTLTVVNCVVANNRAVAGTGADALGGGI